MVDIAQHPRGGVRQGVHQLVCWMHEITVADDHESRAGHLSEGIGVEADPLRLAQHGGKSHRILVGLGGILSEDA